MVTNGDWLKDNMPVMKNDILKRALIDALIKGGYIDGYKKSVQVQVMQESSLTLRRIHCQTGNSE